MALSGKNEVERESKRLARGGTPKGRSPEEKGETIIAVGIVT